MHAGPNPGRLDVTSVSARTIKAIQRKSYTVGVFQDLQVEVGEVVEETLAYEGHREARVYGQEYWYVCNRDVDVSPGDVVVTHTQIGDITRIIRVLP